MINNISGLTFDIVSSSASYSFLNEAGIQMIANAMNAKVHIGTGSGNITGYSSYTAPIAGTPFVEIGDFYFTIMGRTTNTTRYFCLYDKNYKQITSSQLGGSDDITAGYSADNIKFIGLPILSSALFIFCEYIDINDITTPCVIYRSGNGITINVYHASSNYDTINLPTCGGTNEVNFVAIQELAFNSKLARFKGLYTSVVQHESSYKTVILNGVTYDVLAASLAAYPTIYCKRS